MKYLFITFILASILIALPVYAETTYTETTKTFCSVTSCGMTFYPYQVAYQENNEWVPIDTTINQEEKEIYGETYSYYSENIYDVYFKDKSGQTAPNTRPVRIVNNDYSITLAPQSLKFEGQSNKHLQGVFATVSGNKVNYVHQFGSGIDLIYRYYQDTLKEELRIDSKQDILNNIMGSPPEGSNLTLKFKVRAYKLSEDQDLDLRIGKNKVSFNATYDVTSKDRISFLDSDGNAVYSIPTPVAQDANGDSIELYYYIDVNTFGNLVIEIKTPWDWLDNATYPVIIDPSVTLNSSFGFLDDTFTIQSGGLSDDRNSGASTQGQIGITDPLGRIEWYWSKWNNTLPLGVLVTNASLWMRVNFFQDYAAGELNIYSVTNQTWREGNFSNAQCLTPDLCEKGITGLRQPDINGSGPSFDTVPSKTAGNFIFMNATGIIIAQQALGNFSMMVNGTNVGNDKFIQIDSKDAVAAANRVILTINWSVPSEGINITVFSAVDNSTVASWNVTITNVTDTATFLSQSNPALLPLEDLPAGDVNVTIWRDDYVNATYLNIINGAHLENLTARIFTQAKDLIDINEPADSSVVDGDPIDVNITTPDFINEDLTNLTYRINNSGVFKSLCENCVKFTGSISVGGFGSQFIEVRANSTIYGERVENSSFSNSFTVYDLLIMDELRNVTMDFSLVEFANLTAFCPTTELGFPITSNFTETLNIGCVFDYIQLNMKLFNQSSVHYRTLIPDVDVEQITFHMFDNITRDPDDNFIDVKLFLDDLTGDFPPGSTVKIRKAINGSIVNIIEQITNAEAAIFAYLGVGERYILSIENSQGTVIRNLGFLIIFDNTEFEKRIRITQTDLTPLLKNVVTWSFSANSTELFINLTYNDTSLMTSIVIFNIFNSTDPTNIILIATLNSTSQDFTLSWPDPVINNTYTVEMIATHLTFGEIRQTAVFIFSDRLIPIGILEQNTIWYQIIALLILMLTALAFGAKAAQFGAVIVVIEAVVFWIFGWLQTEVAFIAFAGVLVIFALLALRRTEK